MPISAQVRDIVSLLTTYSRGTLRDPDILAELLQHAQDHQAFAALGDLSFRGKHLARVRETLGRQAPGSDLHERLLAEFSTALQEFRQLLADFTADAHEELSTRIDRHYLAVSEQALQHLLTLAHDLEWLKNMELDMAQDGQ